MFILLRHMLHNLTDSKQKMIQFMITHDALSDRAEEAV